MKLRVTLTGLILCSLLTAFPGVTQQQTKSTTPGNQRLAPDTDKARGQLQRAERMSGTVRRMSKLLAKEKVPFEPTILFARNWKNRVRPYLQSMPQMWKTETLPQRFGGAKIANIVYLPDKIELTGDTIILANYLVFAGKKVEIVGYDDLLVFPMESVFADNNDGVARNGSSARFVEARYGSEKELLKAKKEGRLVSPESVTISVDGWGADQYLERERQRKSGSVAHHAFQNADQTAGATGETGERGEPGQSQPQASVGVNGTCTTNPHGVAGSPGLAATSAGTGKKGGRGGNGEDGNVLNWPIDAAVSWHSFSAKGGRGGKGGKGGPGGFGAIGGQGGDGGLAAVCPCPQFSGNGGPGGAGGKGSTGGWGGVGGQGGNGGRGGIINLTIPCNYNSPYTTNVSRGGLGPGGEPGDGTIGGVGGPGGAGKPGGSNPNCPSLGGLPGGPGGGGPAGEPGEHGSSGEDGQAGPSDGSVNVTYSGNCGGGGGMPELEPGAGFSEYCTPYYWVWYHCEEDLNVRLNVTDQRSKNAHHAGGERQPVALFAWVCVEVERRYAGCW